MSRKATIAVAVAATLLCSAGAAQAVTYNLHVRAYCRPTSNLCGFGDVAAYRERVFDAVQEMNLQWETTGISFRPIIFQIQEENYYSETDGCADVPDAIKARREEWRAQAAAQYPYAISMLITEGPNRCCTDPPDSPYTVPNDPNDDFPSLLGVFCDANRSAYDTGSVWAHEVGHYFCLRHTFSFQDSADTAPDPPAYDYDFQFEVEDTPGDPGGFEGYKEDKDGNPKPGIDSMEDGTPINGHEWCKSTQVAPLIAALTLDDGSPHSSFCSMACFQRQGGVTSALNEAPLARAALSYYGSVCRGPYVINGVRYESFTQNSMDEIDDCVAQVPDRAVMTDACANKGGDADHDGICQADDNCPADKNTSQKDTDYDGDGDACDLCPTLPFSTGDLDEDGHGDACDDDKDGDGCDNDVDQHPLDGYVVTGSAFTGCGFGTEATTSYEGDHSDSDQIPNCEDFDDDDDGICDTGGPYADNDPDAPGVPAGGCQPGPGGNDICPTMPGLFGCHLQGSPVDCPPSWLDCLGSGCIEFFLKLVSVINPPDQVIFDSFQILNRSIYIPKGSPQNMAGATVSEMSQAFQGNFEAVAGASQGGSPAPGAQLTTAAAHGPSAVTGPLRLEIWSRRTGQRVAVVAEYDPGQVSLGTVNRGGFLAVTPTMGPTGEPRILIQSVHALAMLSAMHPLDDPDADGRPDAADNCRLKGNLQQVDADGDGFGNACDADLDGDLMVTQADLDAVRGCEGADLTLEVPISEPDDGDLNGTDQPLPPATAVALAIACRAADLNDDRLVDSADTTIAGSLIGRPPGPSSNTSGVTACGGPCDDHLACTHDYCHPILGCVSVPGDCNDANPCTVDACDPATGQCLHSPLACDDGNACTRDFCDPAAGGCTSVPEPDGLSCDDGSRCTGLDACLKGLCVGSPTICDDRDPCTADACDPATGACVTTGGACDDGNPCTRDFCGAGGGCSHVSEADGTPCDDANACTVGDVCRTGQCQASPRTCVDGDPCTADTCDPAAGGCVFPPLNCDDGNACTVDSCDPEAGGCVHQPVAHHEVPLLDFLDPLTLRWTTTSAQQWNTYRGTIPSRMLGSRPPAARYDHLCFESADFALNGPNRSQEYAAPPLGEAFYYDVTEETTCGEGPFGRDSSGVGRPMLQPCATPP